MAILNDRLPRWARTWSTSCDAFCACDGVAELADLEREAGALEAKAAAIRARLESARREYNNHKTLSYETAEEE